jgi:hypothetical protein
MNRWSEQRSDTIGLLFDDVGLLGMPGSRRLDLDAPEIIAPPLRSDVHRIALRGWEDRLRAEYVGVMIMRRFHGLLVDLNAPMDLQELALAMTLQEQQHTRLCAAAAKALGSDLEVAFTVQELQQARSAEPLAEQAMAMIVGTFLCGEGVALELLKYCIAELPKNGFSGVLRLIARDEVLHVGFGVRLLAWLRRNPDNGWLAYRGDAWVRDFVAQQVAMMTDRDIVEPDEQALFAQPLAAAQLRSVGIADSAAFAARYHQALADKIPSLLAGAGVEERS